MKSPTALQTAIATAGLSVVSAAAVVMGPPASAAQSPPPVTREVTLTAAAVPPGGLLASVLINQVRYCAIICPLVVDTAVTAGTTILRVPVTFLSALPSSDLLHAIGAAAASVTGPTNEAAQAAIVADGSRVAPRALNALEVGVVGLLDVLPATAGGLPGIVDALQTAREDTFTALNAPIVADPAPTAHPDGVLQVVVVESLNVVGAVIFPAFNHVLSAVFDVPDAFASELAVSGNLGLAAAAGVRTAAGHVHAAVSVVGQTVRTGLQHVATAIEDSRPQRTSAKRDVDAATPQRRDRHTETAGVRHVRGARASRTERADATSAGKRLAERADRGRGARVERRR
ncbi:hypothetical protein [Mycolicibacterium psychrotolerans]|uniref:PE-PGRS family protein n=1 Tax=Mycolicibacterium psychrotolerans TaxID=216929 RepID=A0A7I7M9W8_9MYCO|nr:hypothetical protein [Mycolicibacterium psychrotolerans]BBX69001.1 hypothetical protein MPSYJ_24620 [Mycolicibacterium psychrotolerans]